MKIVLGVHHYPPRYVGGVELVAERMARSLVGRGHSVEVICVESIDEPSGLSARSGWQDGVLVHRLSLRLADPREAVSVSFRNPEIFNWCSAQFERSRPDLFHGLSSYMVTASALEAAVELGIPTVAGLDDYWYFCPRMSLLRSDGKRCADSASPTDCAWCLMGDSRRYRLADRMIDRVTGEAGRAWAEAPPRKWLVDRPLVERIDARQAYLDHILSQVDAILTPAPLVRDLLTARKHLAHKVRLLEHGLDVDAWQPAVHPARGQKLRIGYLGQIIPAKGVHVLVEAFKRLSPKSAAELLIFGDTSRFPAYAAKLRRLAGDDSGIQFRGAYAHAELASVLAEIDVLAFPSSWFEILGIVILEAVQAGVPVIASRLPNHCYQVRDEIDGLLFEADNVADLARQLQRVCDDPSLLPKLASNARPVRTLRAEIAELEAVYASVARIRTAA